MQIIKVPGINNLDKGIGCRNAGNVILNELKEFMDKRDFVLLNLEEIHVDNNKIDEQWELIYKNSKEVFEIQDKVIFLGGDHSISHPIGKAFLETFGKEKSYLVVFDAHPDCMPALREPTHEEWLNAIVKDGWDPSKIILIGLRKIEPEERKFLDEKGIKYWEMDKFSDMEIMCDSIMEFVNNDGYFYFSLDIDAVDPAFAPSTGYLEPGGFTSREILYFVKRISKLGNMRAFDLVEIDSEKDKNIENITVKLGAKILKEVLDNSSAEEDFLAS